MTSSRSVQFAWLILLLTQFGSINSSGQNSLIRPAFETPNYVKDDITNTSSTSPGPEERANIPPLVPLLPRALSSRDPRKLSLVDRAYLDVFTILSDDNKCSRFFGGRYAINALNEMVLQLKPRYFEHDVAIRMSGSVTMVQSHATGFTFRLFEKMELNMAGAFYRSASPTERHVAITPIYAPNTRETRALVFLHELGHLVRGTNNTWVLSDDGDDPSRSLGNTERVLSVCRQQITSLADLTAAQELEMTTTLAQKIPSKRPPN